jgi:microcystin-dependent protein
MFDAYMGTIVAFGFDFTPKGWLPCNGQLISITSNSALYSLLGTYYGGDGVQNFALPNLQGRVGVSQGQGPGLSPVVLGQVGGSAAVSISVANLPAHSHGLSTASTKVHDGQGDSSSPKATFAANVGNGYHEATTATSAPNLQGTTDPVGNAAPINVLNPYLGLNYCICVEGIYPSRG